MSSDVILFLEKVSSFISSHSCRRLCASRRCNLHGTADKAGLEFSVHSRSSHHADIGHTSERKSPNSIWSNESELSLLYYLSFFCVSLQVLILLSSVAKCRVNTVWHELSKALNLLSKSTRKMVSGKFAVKFLIKQKM